MPDRLCIATIDLKNYAHNIAEIRKNLQPTTKLMAIVKANAYGHGIVKIAEAALKAGASHLGVVSLGELKTLREAQLTVPILVLNYLDSASIAEALEYDGTITVMDAEVIDTTRKVAATQNKIAKLHLKIDTGMHRAGCDPEDFIYLAKKIHETPHLELEGVFTHFAESEAIDDTYTKEQLTIFNTYLEALNREGIRPPLIHAANSAAILAVPQSHFSMVRPGIITYGLNPFDPEHPKHSYVQEQFKPVLSLSTIVAFVRKLETGETVGYNRKWRAERPSTVALLPIGYGDGWRRSPHNAGRVLIHGQAVSIIGSVAMDQIVVDITDIEEVAVGDEAVLIGPQQGNVITADDVAKAYGTINYEVVTALADRIVREYIV